ncbi:MAG: hypothetical protein IKP51_09330 [Treponema sp.]|nr:hypothetical protein [Treponema sp.]
MKKFIFILAFIVASACAFASPATDAVRTFFAKGGCLAIDMQLLADKKESVTVSASIPKEKIYMIYVANGKAEGKDYDSIICIVEGKKMLFPMKYVKSLSNDELGNIVIKLVTLDEKTVENAEGDFGRTLDALLSDLF